MAGTMVTSTPEDTERAGAALGRGLRAGDCVCLSGPLGAGKTTFVRGAMRALGVRERAVSPTFTLAREARGRVRVAHLDFYRLDVPAERRGLLEYLDGRRVVFVEWAERDRSFWPRSPVRVRIAPLSGGRRRITVTRGRSCGRARGQPGKGP
jgi:tRNA threonylcarbamoyladenosine biosynthesis protein TsaE